VWFIVAFIRFTILLSISLFTKAVYTLLCCNNIYQVKSCENYTIGWKKNLDLAHCCTNITIIIVVRNCCGKSYGCGIVGGRIGGCGAEGMAVLVVRNGSTDGLAGSLGFRSMACPFLYTVEVMFFPAILC
jgi:hypothetical protein